MARRIPISVVRDVRYANGTCEQGSETHKPDEEVHPPEEVIKHLEEYLRIKHHSTLFIRRIHEVSHRNGLTDTVCQLRHHHALTTCSYNHIHLFASVIDFLHQCERQRHLLFRTTIDVHPPR